MYPKECPNCKKSLEGGKIIDTFKKQRDEGVKIWNGCSDEDLQKYINESYGKQSSEQVWSRVIGIEFQGEYDGISAWQCPDCKYQWNRFTGKPIIYPFTRKQNDI